MFTFRPNNAWNLQCFFIEAQNRNYLIDTACGSADVEEIRAYIATLNQEQREKPLVVINTHHHWDHVWGNFCFEKEPIFASEACAELCEKYGEIMLSENPEFVSGKVVLSPPDHLFEKEFSFPDDGIYLFLSLGHTSDGVCVYDSFDKVLYAGDNIGDNVNTPLPFLECTKQEYKDALNYMKSLDFVVLCSGHNSVLTKAFLDEILTALEKA